MKRNTGKKPHQGRKSKKPQASRTSPPIQPTPPVEVQIGELKPLGEVAADLKLSLQNLPENIHSGKKLADLLGLQLSHLNFMVQDGILEGEWVDGNCIISDTGIHWMREQPDAFIGALSLNGADLGRMIGLPGTYAGQWLGETGIEPLHHRKVKGKTRSIYCFADVLKMETEMMTVAERIKLRVQEKFKKIIIAYHADEQNLMERCVRTADRLVQSGLATGEVPVRGEFVLDDWQIGAIQSLEAGRHVFVQAPTGAGKTAVIEEYLKRNLDAGINLFYAVPIKALANDKYFDFCELYGADRVGINTGDITLKANADIVVGTTEIVRNILMDRPDAYKVVAFDEAQYLGDEERGSAWEEAIIMAHSDTLMCFLSGSVANAEEVLGWIRNIKSREVSLFIEDHRPVPLQFAFPYGEGYLQQEDWPALKLLAQKTNRSYHAAMPAFFSAVLKAEMTPLLLFMPRRRDCEEILEGLERIDGTRSSQLNQFIDEHEDGHTLNLRLRLLITTRGVAYHHSGLLPSEKRVVETLAKKGRLRMITATMSLASGVNFSVRTCMISGYRRPGNGGNMQDLLPSEILQMWGRAGRRRLDTEGYVIPCMNINDAEGFKKIQAFPQPIVRSNFVSAMNILSILSRHDIDMLEELYRQSFSSFVYNTKYRIFSDSAMERDAGAICGASTYHLPPYRQGVYKNLPAERMEKEFRCFSCSNLKRCTKTYEEIKPNPLQTMLKHLIINDYLQPNFKLTRKGSFAERFHSEIGLLVAEDIVHDRVKPAQIIEYCASANAAAYKDFSGTRQRFFHPKGRQIYPSHLFPSMWEMHRGRKAFIYWNPGAGQLARRWVNADSWEDFMSDPDMESMQGDIFRMLLRAGELLKSMSMIGDLDPVLAEAAHVGCKLIMRPPLIPDSLFKEDLV